MRWRLLIGGALAAAVAALAIGRPRRRGRALVYIGTQATGAQEGIYAAWLDEPSGALTPIGWVAQVERPTWLHADRQRKRLFAVSEVGNDGSRDGAVLAYRYDPKTAALTWVERAGSGGGGATHLDLSADGGTLFVANFGGGNVGAFPVAADGRIGEVTALQSHEGSGPHRRQPGPRPHGVTLDPSGRFLLAPDMGADRLYVYDFDREAVGLSPAHLPFVALPAGSGPRLLLFGRGGRFAYLLTELSAELFVFRWTAGALQLVQQLPLGAPGEQAHSAAALALSADGRFLYASNRVADMVQVYAVSPQDGLLTEVQRVAAGGSKPWGFGIAPGGQWLLVANQAPGNVAAFRVDGRTGKLAAAGDPMPVPDATCIAFG